MIESLIIWLIIGAIAGWLAGQIVKGHGFGLHSGALAAKELGGTLKVRSEGPGAGATFTLELPLETTTQP